MKKAVPKPKHFEELAADGERLRAKAEKLLIDFLDADLDTANSFLELARLDFRTGEAEHASRLLEHAERAADVIEGLMHRVPENAAAELWSRLEGLKRAIGEIKARTG